MLKDLKENSVMRRKSKFKKEWIEFVQMRNIKWNEKNHWLGLTAVFYLMKERLVNLRTAVETIQKLNREKKDINK